MKKLKLKKINLKKKSKDKGNKKPITKNNVLSILLIAGIALISVALVFALYIIISSPDFDKEKLYSKESSVLYYNDGKTELARLGQYDRVLVNYDELPQVLIDALIATEDSRFYEHNGVDMARFLKATALNLMGKDDAGGASTLTMQTVKNNLTKKDSKENNKIKKIIRKFQDVYLSVFFMEKKYSKNEILEMYVNDSCLGGRIYGVGEASKY